jgi:hypothetical protein
MPRTMTNLVNSLDKPALVKSLRMLVAANSVLNDIRVMLTINALIATQSSKACSGSGRCLLRYEF